MHTDSFGSMDGTYFVSRGELIQWVNSSFNQNISKIEELSTGAIFCQIFNECMPGKLNYSKVNWSAKNDYEFVSNLKILQLGFTKCNIKKNINIEKLAKGKCQDNLEFLQWMKKFFDCNFNGKTEVKQEKKRKVLTERNSIETGRRETRVRNVSQDTGEKKSEKLKELEKNKILLEGIQGERDFYFEKLRQIELLVHDFEKDDHPLVKSLKGIIYSQEGEN